METVLVNRADWRKYPAIPDGWVVANAPRPLDGTMTWVGPFVHGTFYAAAPEIVTGTFGWQADDARLIELIDDDEIERRVLARIAEFGYDSIGDTGCTLEELAADLGLPWHGRLP